MTQLLMAPGGGGGGSDPNAVNKSLINAKGDLIIGDADNSVSRFAVGGDGTVLEADAAQALGLKWTNLAAAITAGIASWVGAAPDSMNTLVEIAALLEDSEDAAAALTAAVAGKLTAASNLSDVADAATARTNLGAASAAIPATGFPVAGQNNLTASRFVGTLNDAGPPVAGDGTFQTNDYLFDSAGVLYRCTAGGTPGTWVSPSISGKSLGHAFSTAAHFATDAVETDVADLALTFTVPPDRDVRVYAKLPLVSHSLANGIVTVKLTDEANVQKDYNQMRTGTASRNHVTLILDELIPAGSGTVTRKVRSLGGGGAGGAINGLATGRATLDAFVR